MCVRSCIWAKRRRWWGSYTSPGEHVMLLSRPQTPPQSTEKMKVDASLLPFLSRLFLHCTELFLCACCALTNTHIASNVNLENSSQKVKMLQSILNGNLFKACCILWRHFVTSSPGTKADSGFTGYHTAAGLHYRINHLYPVKRLWP